MTFRSYERDGISSAGNFCPGGDLVPLGRPRIATNLSKSINEHKQVSDTQSDTLSVTRTSSKRHKFRKCDKNAKNDSNHPTKGEKFMRR